LFERESVQRHIKKSGAAREEIASDVEGRVGTGCWLDGGNTSDTLTKCGANGAQRMPDKDNFGAVLQPFDQQQNGAYGVGQVGSTRLAREHKGPTDLVAVPYTKTKRAQSDTDDETWVEGQVNPTLSLFDCGDVRTTTAIAIPIMPQAMQADGWRVGKENKDGRGNGLGVGKDGDPCLTLDRSAVLAVAIQGSMIGRQDHNGPAGSGCSSNGEMFTLTSTDTHAVACINMGGNKGGASTQTTGASYTLSGNEPHAVAFPINTMTKADVHRVAHAIPLDLRNSQRDPEKHDEQNQQGLGVGSVGDPAPTVDASFVHGVAQAMTVRRLTPRECERLQGFSDDYTLIPWRKKAAGDCPDGPRYKALGNSMAVNCMEWIGERIAAVEAREDK
jgi:DNA (cytosine-5)-methyltransferase 1